MKVVCTGYENQGICSMCEGQLGERRRAYCSEECAECYAHLFSWGEAQRDALKQAHRRCQVCGISGNGLFKVGVKLLGWDDNSVYVLYRLEVHHIIPLNGEDRTWHRLNVPSNLLVVCHDCHVLLHTPAKLKKLEHQKMQPVLI